MLIWISKNLSYYRLNKCNKESIEIAITIILIRNLRLKVLSKGSTHATQSRIYTQDEMISINGKGGPGYLELLNREISNKKTKLSCFYID